MMGGEAVLQATINVVLAVILACALWQEVL